jgi:hypothetical protein
VPERWIVIPNWDRFQHYRDRNPVWIKTYTELMADDNYLNLTGHCRAILHGLWLEYAISRRQLAHDTAMISRRLNLRVTKTHIEALGHAGFIHLSASRPLAQTEKSGTSYLTDRETERASTAGAALPGTRHPEDPENHHLVLELLTEIRDADTRTAAALRSYEHRLPEHAFARALESLRHRRGNGRPLQSEARYVIGTLRTIDHERETDR